MCAFTASRLFLLLSLTEIRVGISSVGRTILFLPMYGYSRSAWIRPGSSSRPNRAWLRVIRSNRVPMPSLVSAKQRIFELESCIYLCCCLPHTGMNTRTFDDMKMNSTEQTTRLRQLESLALRRRIIRKQTPCVSGSACECASSVTPKTKV